MLRPLWIWAAFVVNDIAVRIMAIDPFAIGPFTIDSFAFVSPG